MLTVRKVEELLYKQYGFERQRTKGPLTFTEAYERYGDCIVTINTHAIAIVNGVLLDTLDWRWQEIATLGGFTYVERTAKSVWVLSQSTLC